MGELILVTTPSLPGYKVKRVLGIVHGLTTRTRGVAGRFVAGFQTLLGGEVTVFTREIEKAREEAIERLREEAEKLGANAVLGIDFETTEVFQMVVLVSAHGTAVVVEPEQPTS